MCRYGWAKKGKNVFVPTNQNRVTFSCIVTHSFEKVIAFDIVQSTIDSEIFCNHLALVKSNLSQRSVRHSVFIYDGAPCHTSKKTQAFLDSWGIEALKLSPYSPMLNLAEKFILVHKQRTQRYLRDLQ